MAKPAHDLMTIELEPPMRRLEKVLQAYRDAPDEPHAVDGEKVARLGIVRDPSLLYMVQDGYVWALPRDGSLRRRITDKPVKTNIKFLYYLDADGDVARRRKR